MLNQIQTIGLVIAILFVVLCPVIIAIGLLIASGCGLGYADDLHKFLIVFGGLTNAVFNIIWVILIAADVITNYWAWLAPILFGIGIPIAFILLFYLCIVLCLVPCDIISQSV